MNTKSLYYSMRLLQLLIGGAMLWGYFSVRAKLQAERPVSGDVQAMVDLLFIPCILIAAWLVFAPVIGPLKKQLKRESQNEKND